MIANPSRLDIGNPRLGSCHGVDWDDLNCGKPQLLPPLGLWFLKFVGNS